jgi:hypothetical protein
MIFWLESLILWYKNGRRRTVDFERNKINVITGGSNTGKSAILQIFDYCLFASKSKIPESAINENVTWYGLKVHINDKIYTIARTSLVQGKATDGYYFSPVGEIPEQPQQTHEEKTLRAIFEAEFGIDRDVKIPFGGSSLKVGAKISLRYFLLFNTISEDIITSSSVFFDKQDEARYREALPRIFDLAVGIETLENLLAKEEQARISSELKLLERKATKVSAGKTDFEAERISVVKRAKEYGVLPEGLSDADAMLALQQVIDFPDQLLPNTSVSTVRSDLSSRIGLNSQILRNLRHLKKEYDEYRRNLDSVEDSLKPIEFIRENLNEVVQTSGFNALLSMIEDDMREVRLDIQKRVPIDTSVSDLIADYEDKIANDRIVLDSLPNDATYISDRDRLLFLGEIKAKLELYGKESASESIETKDSIIAELEGKLKDLVVKDTTEERTLFLKLLEEVILEYMKIASEALVNYQDYLPVFDYTQKTLNLRKPKTMFVENVGSSSTHMFLHLFLFLGLHEVIQIQKVPFIAPLIFIDQPSRPYWGDGITKKSEIDASDEGKIRRAFEVLDSFIERSNANGVEPQLIVIEHVPESTWAGLAHVHLVEEFADGVNALVRPEDLA